jgi:DNA-binding NarL/FixJ family response regulator
MVKKAVVLAERYRPDVTLMDIRLPRVSGVEATRQINDNLPQSMIIGMSSLYTPHSYNAMMAAGAVAFVRKEDAVEVLYKTLAFALYTYLSKSTPLGLHDRLNGGVEREIGCRSYPGSLSSHLTPVTSSSRSSGPASSR